MTIETEIVFVWYNGTVVNASGKIHLNGRKVKDGVFLRVWIKKKTSDWYKMYCPNLNKLKLANMKYHNLQLTLS